MHHLRLAPSNLPFSGIRQHDSILVELLHHSIVHFAETEQGGIDFTHFFIAHKYRGVWASGHRACLVVRGYDCNKIRPERFSRSDEKRISVLPAIRCESQSFRVHLHESFNDIFRRLRRGDCWEHKCYSGCNDGYYPRYLHTLVPQSATKAVNGEVLPWTLLHRNRAVSTISNLIVTLNSPNGCWNVGV